MVAKPAGETMFERYLAENQLRFRYHPPSLGHLKRPDYWVETTRGKVFVENTDFLIIGGAR